ncbi:MAG TPA: hypothetical protein VLC46_15080 [Thermoanaerobaculia bacterium]|jgi:hypothetical protein|nr:hypothetical protein [Thermoanaerobaculia bacterium]
MRDVRRTAVWLLVLVAIVLAGDRAGDVALSSLLRRSQFRFSRVYGGNERAAILIVGDSRGVDSFYAPRIRELTGQETLNLSYNALSSRIAEQVLRDYLDRNRPPRIVVLEVTNTTAPMSLVSELRTYANISPRMRALYAEQHPLAAKTGRVFRLLAYDSEMFLRSLYYLHRSDQGWNAQNTIPPELLRPASMPPRLLRVSASNLDAFERTVRLLHERGIEVRLVLAPYLDPMNTVNLDDFIRTIDQRAQRVDPALRVRNYIAAGGSPDNFADRAHVNNRGADFLLARLLHDGVFAP